MACVLKAFVLWNAVSMLWCCGGNLVGLRYPPKWLYYTNTLYDFYLMYETSGGKALGESSMVAPPSVHIESSRVCESRTHGEVTGQSLLKRADATIKTRSQALGLKWVRQPVNPAEDCTTTILPAGTMTGKSGGRCRRQSVTTAEDGNTTTAGTKCGKTGRRSRRQSRGPAEDCTATIMPAGSKSGKISGHSRKLSVAGEGRANVKVKCVKPATAMSKGKPVSTNAASTIRKPTTHGSRRQSISGARGKQTDGKKSWRQSITAAVGASATADPTRKSTSGSRRQSVTTGAGTSSVGSTPPLQTSRRQSLSGAPASEVAQLVAARKARRRSLKSEDATGIAAFAASKKPAWQSRKPSITTVETKDALEQSDTPPLCPGGEDRV
ncbi:hypothetical protein HPB51_026742 [Rhipicephalus microplus]|uniref:Uncharacterized protein n=1 Tax=Rhipicephalus microplus TaxID=6941 RepID=A0A9J6D227_RHIMP|nr:hypothetical protein HPB51_026742 [Rhipicephalus microplus]